MKTAPKNYSLDCLQQSLPIYHTHSFIWVMYSKNAGHPKLPVSNSKGSERTQKHPPWTAAKAAIEPPRRADLSSPSRPQISLTSPAPTRRASSSREPTPTRRGCASPCRPLLVKPTASRHRSASQVAASASPRRAGCAPPRIRLQCRSRPAVVLPGCAGCAPSRARLAVVVHELPHPVASYAVSYGCTKVDDDARDLRRGVWRRIFGFSHSSNAK